MENKKICRVCKTVKPISQFLGVCKDCIRNFPDRSISYIKEVHEKARKMMNVPAFIPKDGEVICEICGNKCRISKGKKGYCGLTENIDGKLTRKIGNEEVGLGLVYKDPHPTNCTAVNWCAGGTGAGYPKYAMKNRTEFGFANASVFLGTCNYHCLYCQNVSWHDMIRDKAPLMKAEELTNLILEDKEYTCVCWFGGTPEPQIPFVWNVSRLIRKKVKQEDRILRICLESNGNFSWRWLKRIAKISLKSGGGIKFDLKTAKGSQLNLALSGVSNEVSYENFERLVKFHQRRPEVPFLRTSTLLVPHYIDLEEIRKITKFIASLDKTIPYSLLAFYPHYCMTDIGLTSRKFALECYKVAKEAGLEKVRIGNLNLLR
ncbi:MAG: radical SAM protein [Candidatus Aenigmarchaeota archaeon]|nr:radical SAM protein [Candidatus Aenigmarchaeota archaeon]